MNDKINNLLENMCIYGNIIKKKIEEEIQKNPNQFIPLEEALKTEKYDQELFALALITNDLKKIRIEAIIEKYENNEEEEDDEEGLTLLNFLLIGLNNKIKKFDLHFDFGEKRNNELLKNEKENNNFKEKLKLSKEYKISQDKIVIAFPQRGSLHVQLIFQSEEFNNLDMEEFRNRFNNDPEYDELNYLKEIHRDLLILIDKCKLSKKFLDREGNRSDDWGIDEERGNKKYYPPIDWIGICIKVVDKYDEGNNEWLGMNNSEGEWCVAYHELCYGLSSDEVKRITENIVKGEKLRPGGGHAHEECEDLNHPGHQVGKGVYVTPKIESPEDYAGKSEINWVNYYTSLMI